MDNKYGLGSTKVSSEIHDRHHKGVTCVKCKSTRLQFCPTMQDHQCLECGEWQNDTPLNYSTGRSSDY